MGLGESFKTFPKTRGSNGSHQHHRRKVSNKPIDMNEIKYHNNNNDFRWFVVKRTLPRSGNYDLTR